MHYWKDVGRTPNVRKLNGAVPPGSPILAKILRGTLHKGYYGTQCSNKLQSIVNYI